ncbi:hypothetical protein ACCO45_002086 [Purpureocillium lilacinum]|uniref:Uncharacterized protein n=1 Tax=Purpureocillium lilacinum TaxID=33203 RepID=A0ACC4EA09_PURLI
MLESVASGKKLPEKNLLVLGGTPESQREFLESLASSESRRHNDRQKSPPIANNFALGYTYYDVLDADQDDTLARVSLYLLSQPSTEFAPLISPLLTPETVQHTALVILLDWSQPHMWLRQVWNWIQVLEEVMGQVSSPARNEMEAIMSSWKERGRGGATINLDGTPSATGSAGDGDGLLPLGPGEWAEPLGLPPLRCLPERKRSLENTSGKLSVLTSSRLKRWSFWKRTRVGRSPTLTPCCSIFEQYCCGLTWSRRSVSHLHISKHALTTASPHPLDPRHHVSAETTAAQTQRHRPRQDRRGPQLGLLGQDSYLRRHVRRRARVERLGRGHQAAPGSKAPTMEDDQPSSPNGGNSARGPSAIAQYEYWCRDPNSGGLAVVESAMSDGSAVGVMSDDPQEFLERQLKILEAFKAKAPETTSEGTLSSSTRRLNFGDEKSVKDHIGPVQFNMGGIQVDADDMLQRLKDRNAHVASPEPDELDEDGPTTNMAKDFDNEQLQNFFSGLMNRTAGAADSPRS